MYDFDDDFDGRNAPRRPRRPGMYGRPYPRPGYGYPPPQAPYPVPPRAPAPWVPSGPPAVDRFTGNLRLGVLIDAAAKALSAMSSLPSAPPVTGDSRVDDPNVVKWVDAALTHFKRSEQIRTAGSLARLFLV